MLCSFYSVELLVLLASRLCALILVLCTRSGDRFVLLLQHSSWSIVSVHFCSSCCSTRLFRCSVCSMRLVLLTASSPRIPFLAPSAETSDKTRSIRQQLASHGIKEAQRRHTILPQLASGRLSFFHEDIGAVHMTQRDGDEWAMLACCQLARVGRGTGRVRGSCSESKRLEGAVLHGKSGTRTVMSGSALPFWGLADSNYLCSGVWGGVGELFSAVQGCSGRCAAVTLRLNSSLDSVVTLRSTVDTSLK